MPLGAVAVAVAVVAGAGARAEEVVEAAMERRTTIGPVITGVKGHIKVDCKFRIRGEEVLAQRGKQNGRGNGPNSKRQKKEADAAIATIGDMDADDSF